MVRADFFATLRLLAVFVLQKPKVLLHNILQNWVWSVIETLLSMMSIEGSGGRPTQVTLGTTDFIAMQQLQVTECQLDESKVMVSLIKLAPLYVHMHLTQSNQLDIK